jgi:hypothetical protein
MKHVFATESRIFLSPNVYVPQGQHPEGPRVMLTQGQSPEGSRVTLPPRKGFLSLVLGHVKITGGPKVTFFCGKKRVNAVICLDVLFDGFRQAAPHCGCACQLDHHSLATIRRDFLLVSLFHVPIFSWALLVREVAQWLPTYISTMSFF